jgi:N-acetylglucosaminyl-diphospho-decaprenol L-rhamnosyltransferase
MNPKPSVNIVVLNYNAKDLLEKFLPSVIAAAKESRYPCRVTVLDNCSTDGSRKYVKQNHPGVVWARAKENKVLCSYNEFAREADDDILVLLNNDIELYSGWVDPIVEVFLREKDVFFAASHGNRAMAGFRAGTLTADIRYSNSDLYKKSRGYTLSAGSAAFDRRKFVELEGFDELYLPGIYEDIDLCWRAWKRGWHGVYEPASTQYHMEGRTSFKKRFGEKKVDAIVFRNSLLFMIKNITDPMLMTYFLCLLPLRLISALLRGKWFLLKGFFEVFERLPQALHARKKTALAAVYSDREVIKKVNEFYHG